MNFFRKKEAQTKDEKLEKGKPIIDSLTSRIHKL